MDYVSVELSQAWPTKQGLRRPQEGPITVTAAEGKKIEEAACGKILGQTETASKTRTKAD